MYPYAGILPFQSVYNVVKTFFLPYPPQKAILSVRNAHSVICNSSARAIRNLALRASKLAHASGLLIIGRSAHNQLNVLIHASMIRPFNWLWLNCYYYIISFFFFQDKGLAKYQLYDKIKYDCNNFRMKINI